MEVDFIVNIIHSFFDGFVCFIDILFLLDFLKKPNKLCMCVV